MASAKHAKSAIPYVQRLFEDEYVQEQLRNAAGGLWVVYQRARRQRADAIEDKGFYGNLRHAATSIRNAVTGLQQPKKPQPKRRLRKLATVALAAGGTALLVIKLQRSQTGDQSGSSEGTGTAAPDGSPQTSQQAPATAIPG